MNLYCERVLYDVNSKTYEAIFDFNSKHDINKFIDKINIQNTTEIPSTKSLLILSNIQCEKYKVPKQGKWYNIPLKTLSDNFVVEFDTLDFRLIKFRGYMLGNSQWLMNFQEYLTEEDDLFLNWASQEIDFKNSKFYQLINSIEPLSDKCIFKLKVRNVGCGNWNEIESNCEFRLIYDFGGDIKFPDSKMKNIIDAAHLSKPLIGVISHWDLDHYRGLIDMSDIQLQLLKTLVVPSKIPSTIQVNQLLNRLNSLGIHIDIIRAAAKRGNYIELVSQGKAWNIELFRSTDGKNINQSGIVIKFEGPNKNAILTGDHHYRQILRSVFIGSTNTKPFELVIPHHGGNAGKFCITDWNTKNLSGGAISTMPGRYRNLPRRDIHNYFNGIKKFHCTYCSSSNYSTIL